MKGTHGHLGEAWLAHTGMSGDSVGLSEMNPLPQGQKEGQGKTPGKVGTSLGLAHSRGLGAGSKAVLTTP